MYYYICHRGPDWNPNETCVLAVSMYPNYEGRDRLFPAGTEEFGGLTVIGRIRTAAAHDAVSLGAVLYSNIAAELGMQE